MADEEGDEERIPDNGEFKGSGRAEHRCTCRLPGSLPTGIFRKKFIPGPVRILSHGSPGPMGNLPAGYRSTGNPGTCRYLVVIGLECLVFSDKQQLVVGLLI